MISNSKILTVSYGTVSCTLEGFDDSFGTMKAIAEYFRDLAADDRYFGAEPPTPDAEMLARIAEREIARRVQAHADGGKIVLRAEEPREETVISRLARTDDAEATKSGVADASATPKEMAFTAPQPARQDQPSPATPVAAQVTDSVEEDAEPTAAQTEEDSAPEDNAEMVAPEAPEEVMEWRDTQDDVAADLEEISRQDHAPAAPVASFEEDGEVLHPDPESVAAKLRRIRSVVSRSVVEAEIEFTEDEHAQDVLNAPSETPEPVTLAADAHESEDAIEDQDEVSTILTKVSEESARGVDDAEETIPETADETILEEVVRPSTEDALEPSGFEDTLAQLLADAMPAPTAEEPEATVADEPADEAEDEAARLPETPPLEARVLKVKRADLDQALATGEIEADEDAPEENLFSEEDSISGAGDMPESALSLEEEAELQRELAELEAEFSPADDMDAGDEADSGDDDAASTVEADEDQEGPVQNAEAERGVDKLQRMKRESDLSRIFDEADTQREEPDSSNRRNAIQHLRAAVAATRAEKQAGRELTRDVDDSPYRSDLADVVRPRRPHAATTRSERPTEERPAPLKLVAEQRIDTQREPVRPRRILTRDLNVEASLAPDGSSFAEFADEAGAASLPELLEAAAAYMADVEGRPQFSRPMLMGKLKEVEGDTFSREDGLRSFGQLLRQGKLQKLTGGRFAVTEETDFRAPKRNVG